jgi:hypothetical protein
VQVIGDAGTDPNDSYFLNLTNATNAGISKSQGVGTILDSGPRVLANGISTLVPTKGKYFSGVVATFIDPDFNTSSSFSALIQWGDGTMSAGGILFDSTKRVWDVIGTHQYAKGGQHAITIVITDANGNTGTAKSMITI